MARFRSELNIPIKKDDMDFKVSVFFFILAYGTCKYFIVINLDGFFNDIECLFVR